MSLVTFVAACGDDDDGSASGATASDGSTAAGITDGSSATTGAGDSSSAVGDDVTSGSGSDASGGGTGTTAAGGSQGATEGTGAAAGGGDTSFTTQPGEKPVPDNALVYFRPVPGATYVYQSTGTGDGTLTYTVDTVTETADGLDVETTVDAAYSTGTVQLGFTFHYATDGSISLPYVDFSGASGGTITVVQQPRFQLLDRAAIESGEAFTGSTEAIFDIGGTQLSATYNYTGRGLGRQSVTVPAGTFDTTVVEIEVSVAAEGPSAATATITSTYYLSDEIGLVKSTYTSDLAGAGATELLSSSLL